MGKILQFAELTKKRDFVHAKLLTTQKLTDYVKAGDIYGAKLYGSVAQGTPNDRSDFDVVIVTEYEDPGDIAAFTERLRRTCDDIYAETSVAIDEPIVMSHSNAERGHHSIDSYFLQHIQLLPIDGNVIGQDPLQIIATPTISNSEMHRAVLTFKRRKIQKGDVYEI